MAKQPAKPRKTASPKTVAASPPAKTPKKTASKKTETGAVTTAPQPAAVPAATEARVKFTLYNFLGKERAHYLVERQNLEQPAEDVPEQSVAHNIIVIDRSGSMYSALDPLKQTLIKLLSLDEYSGYEMLVTLLSYSSHGDVACHFQRVPIQEVMKRDSRYLKEIQRIHITGATCISQALREAAGLVRDNELTAITLHSDGYANDPSANAESKALEQICQSLQGRAVFVNTIAYSDFSDFRLLARVANSVSGNCLKAGNTKQVYEAIDSTARLLGSSVAPPLEIPLPSGSDYQVFVSHKRGKLNGAAGPLRICGLKADDDAAAYRYRKLTKQEFDKLKDVPAMQRHEAVFAFARANLAEGNLNTAKYALASTFDATLTEKHARALTNLEVAELALDLEVVLFQPTVLQEHELLDFVRVNKRISILELVRLLGENRDGFLLNLPELQKNYRRRGVRRVNGSRDENGNLIEPWLKVENIDKDDYVRVQSFDINRNTATLNLLISRRVKLVKVADGKSIDEVAGIKLDKLSTFNNYTLISDGELNVPTLQLRISSKKLFDELKGEEGLLEQEGQSAAKFDAKADYTLRLDRLPVVPPFEGAVNLDGVFTDLAAVKVLTSLLAAQLKEEAAELTLEQVEELKKHYLSKNLYLNFPTTTEYTDLQKAIGEGSIDSRVSYKVDVGNRDILNLGKLHSANKFLDRMYELTDAQGNKVDKPTCELLLEEGMQVKHKQLSARTKVTKVDDFMKKIFDDCLGLDKNGSVAEILERVGDDKLAKALEAKRKGKLSRQQYVEVLEEARRKLERYADALFEEKVSPLVFYIGATGVLPDEIEAKAQTAEALANKYPNLQFSKDEQEGMYFEVGESILGIFAKNEYFSTR